MIPRNKVRLAIGKTPIRIGKHPLRNNKSKYDSDGDGYVNSIDCKPHNKNKDGFFSDLKDKAVKKFNEVKVDRAEKEARQENNRRDIRPQVEKEERKQAALTARSRLQEKGNADRRQIKQRYAERKPSSSGGGSSMDNRLSNFLGGGSSSRPTGMQGLNQMMGMKGAENNIQQAKKVIKRKTVKRRKKRKVVRRKRKR